MISLASGLPLLQLGDQGVSDYSPQWLENSIQQAAAEAGHDKWWFATDIVKSLFLYLKERFQSSVITINELFGKIRHTLEALGFGDIASRLHDQMPPWRISLTKMAFDASQDAYELHFFPRLKQQLDQAGQSGAELIYADGLRDAVKLLCSTNRWKPQCEKLRGEVLTFINDHLKSGQALRVRVS